MIFQKAGVNIFLATKDIKSPVCIHIWGKTATAQCYCFPSIFITGIYRADILKSRGKYFSGFEKHEESCMELYSPLQWESGY